MSSVGLVACNITATTFVRQLHATNDSGAPSAVAACTAMDR